MTLKAGERVRLWVVAAGPSDGISFHIVGTVFDNVYKEGALLKPGQAGGSQVLDLSVAEGGFVETTFPAAGHYSFVDHDMRHAEAGRWAWWRRARPAVRWPAGRARRDRTWITAPGANVPYGIPLTALGPQDADGRIPMRDFTGRLPLPHLPDQHFERHAQVALLWTAHDRREDWLRAGQGLEHVLLTATAHGVRTSMLHQAMEWPDLRAAACLPQRCCCPQLLIRFGYGPDGGRTPRASAQPVRHRVD